MIRFLFRRIFVFLVRAVTAAVILGLAAEFALSKMDGGESRHFWDVFLISPESQALWAGMLAKAMASLRVLAIAWSFVVFLSLGLSVFSARFRNALGIDVILLPLFALVWIPGFWVVLTFVIWLTEAWAHPGFANEISPIDHNGLNPWWHALILGVVLAAGALGWQIKFSARGIKDAAKAKHLRASYIRGHSGKSIFYDQILKNSLDYLWRAIDLNLAPTLGMLAIVEWAFRYEGLGHQLVGFAQGKNPEGVFAIGLSMTLLGLLVLFVRELCQGITNRRVRLGELPLER